MTIEELEEEIYAALDGAVWVNVSLRRWTGRTRWLLRINGKEYPVPSKKEGLRFISLFFTKAAMMDVANE